MIFTAMKQNRAAYKHAPANGTIEYTGHVISFKLLSLEEHLLSDAIRVVALAVRFNTGVGRQGAREPALAWSKTGAGITICSGSLLIAEDLFDGF